MLHHIGLVGILDRSLNHLALYIPAIDKTMLEGTVASRDHRFANISFHASKVHFPLDRKKVCCDLSSIYLIDHILLIAVSTGVQLILIVLYKTDRDLRVRKGNSLHHLGNIARLCLGGF